MSRIGYLVIALSLTTPVLAQQKFVPITVDEQDAQNLRKYLDEQPMKFSLPILQWLDGLEVKAQQSKKELPKDNPPK